ncbi:hypothetical protein LX36DRAFT_360081 [Colletotrichum falcatum]|nr:hypothetical protein LX36DRAFT_360081 [Colletotrichum falcatum]
MLRVLSSEDCSILDAKRSTVVSHLALTQTTYLSYTRCSASETRYSVACYQNTPDTSAASASILVRPWRFRHHGSPSKVSVTTEAVMDVCLCIVQLSSPPNRWSLNRGSFYLYRIKYSSRRTPRSNVSSYFELWHWIVEHTRQHRSNLKAEYHNPLPRIRVLCQQHNSLDDLGGLWQTAVKSRARGDNLVNCSPETRAGMISRRTAYPASSLESKREPPWCLHLGLFFLTSPRQIRELQNATSQVLGFLFTETVTSIASFALALGFSWKLTLVLVATVPLAVIALALTNRRLQSAITRKNLHLADASKQIHACLTAVDLVKVFGGCSQGIRAYTKILDASVYQ